LVPLLFDLSDGQLVVIAVQDRDEPFAGFVPIVLILATFGTTKTETAWGGGTKLWAEVAQLGPGRGGGTLLGLTMVLLVSAEVGGIRHRNRGD
jgi:hypothetical protein